MNDDGTNAGTSQGLVSRLVALGFSALPAIGGAIGFVGFVAIIGGAIQFVRFDAAQLPASQAVAAMSRGELVALGAQAIITFTFLGAVAVLIVYLADPGGDGNVKTMRALVAVTVLEFATALIMVRASALGVLGALALFVAVVWVITQVFGASRLWLGVGQLRRAKAKWEQAADAVRVQRSLASTAAASGASVTELETMFRRRVSAERRLAEAEAHWASLVDLLEPVVKSIDKQQAAV